MPWKQFTVRIIEVFINKTKKSSSPPSFLTSFLWCPSSVFAWDIDYPPAICYQSVSFRWPAAYPFWKRFQQGVKWQCPELTLCLLSAGTASGSWCPFKSCSLYALCTSILSRFQSVQQFFLMAVSANGLEVFGRSLLTRWMVTFGNKLCIFLHWGWLKEKSWSTNYESLSMTPVHITIESEKSSSKKGFPCLYRTDLSKGIISHPPKAKAFFIKFDSEIQGMFR